MAVVFISPKQRQYTFFLIITALFVVLLIVIFFGVFSAKPKAVPGVLVFNEPKITINMKVFDSDQFKNLQPVPEMEIQYKYNAMTKDNQAKSGFISAASEEEAKAILAGEGLSVTFLQEAEIGRDNPFIPYYTQIATPSPAGKNGVAKSATTTITNKKTATK